MDYIADSRTTKERCEGCRFNFEHRNFSSQRSRVLFCLKDALSRRRLQDFLVSLLARKPTHAENECSDARLSLALGASGDFGPRTDLKVRVGAQLAKPPLDARPGAAASRADGQTNRRTNGRAASGHQLASVDLSPRSRMGSLGCGREGVHVRLSRPVISGYLNALSGFAGERAAHPAAITHPLTLAEGRLLPAAASGRLSEPRRWLAALFMTRI